MSEISDDAIQKLKKEHNVHYKESLVEEDEAELLIIRSNVYVDLALLSKLPFLKFIIKAGSGIDNIDLDRMKERDVRLFTTPVNAHSVAELALLMILALRKRLGRLNAALKEGNWNAKYEVKGHNLYKSSLGIIGYGNIGRKLSLIANVIGMKILIYDHHPFDSIKQEHASRAKGTFVSLEELLMNSDTVSLHVPLTDGTRYMIDCPQFNLCRPNCILINTARADLVNPTALQEALLEKKIAGLGIDVHYHEPIHRIDALINMDNVLATPHVGSQTVENIELIGERIIDIITMLNNKGDEYYE